MKLVPWLRRSAGAITLATVGLAMGCAPAAAEDVAEDEGAYKVPVASEQGEKREIQLSDFPARSRDADERRANKPDAIVATWHVHLVTLTGGARSVLVYGADKDGDVRSAFVIDAEDPNPSSDVPAHTVFYIEPEKEAKQEDLAVLTTKAQQSVSAERLRWFSEEFARMKVEIEKNWPRIRRPAGSRRATSSGAGSVGRGSRRWCSRRSGARS